jgi:hypothetical protein
MSPLPSLLAAAPAVAFSGGRSLPPASVAALRLAAAAVPPSASVLVGCAAGADAVARSLFPAASVFAVSSGRWGVGRSAFARRSAAVVAATVAAGGWWLSFPRSACPVGLLPSPSPSRCFSGFGSGSWASLALAVGSALPCLVFLPPGVAAPVGWGLSPLGGVGGWPVPPLPSSHFFSFLVLPRLWWGLFLGRSIVNDFL